MHATVDLHRGDVPGTAELAVAGELDVLSGRRVREAMERAAGDGVRTVELDLREVTFLDSSGLAAVLHGARDLSARGVAVAARSPRGSEARLVIEMAGVGPLLGLQDEA
jgi:anti-sigma B factor antagonist